MHILIVTKIRLVRSVVLLNYYQKKIRVKTLSIFYYIYGGFVVPILLEVIRSIISKRRYKFNVTHFLSFIVLLYLFTYLWIDILIGRSSIFQIGFYDFIRWHIREITPIICILIAITVKQSYIVDNYVRSIVVIGGVLGYVGIIDYVLAYNAGKPFFGLIKIDPSGYLFFTAWLDAHNAAGGLFSAISSISLVWYLNRKLSLWIFAGNLIALSLTGSRTGFISFIMVAVIAILFVRKLKGKHLVVGIIGLLLLGGGPAYSRLVNTLIEMDYNTQARFMLWDQAVLAFITNPIFGVGWGRYGFYSDNIYATGASTHAHNSYLQVLAETGLMGFIIIGMWFLVIIKKLWFYKRYDLLSALISIAISSLAEHNFGSPTVTAPVFIAIGMAINSDLGTRKEKGNRYG